MEPERLREHLTQLHAELREAQGVDPRSSELLGQLLEDIHRLLAQRGVNDAGAPGAQPTSAAGEPTLRERLERTAVQFEADHPTLAVSSRRLIDLLGKAGL